MIRFLTLLVLLSALACAFHLYSTRTPPSFAAKPVAPTSSGAQARPSTTPPHWPGPNDKPLKSHLR